MSVQITGEKQVLVDSLINSLLAMFFLSVKHYPAFCCGNEHSIFI